MTTCRRISYRSPDENHWVLTPNHAKVWYSTVFAFLAHHVLGEDWRTPDLLR